MAGATVWMSLAALAVMAGHAFPVFLKFHGGKAVASFIRGGESPVALRTASMSRLNSRTVRASSSPGHE